MTDARHRTRMVDERRERQWPAIVWLLLVAVVLAVLLVVLVDVFVRTREGQLIDNAALTGASVGRRHIIDPVRQVLDLVSALSVAVATIVIGAVALARRRFLLAVAATALIAVANLSTQLLKNVVIVRPDLTGESAAQALRNTLPSGHTTVAASVAVALVLVVPPAVRGSVALLGAVYAGATGVATLSAGWHRPSDAIASYLVVGVWTALLGAGIVALGDRREDPRVGRHPAVTALLTLGGVGLVALGTVALLATGGAVVADMDRGSLLVAYGGGACAIAGTALLIMAALLVVVHRIAPARQPTVARRRAEPDRS